MGKEIMENLFEGLAWICTGLSLMWLSYRIKELENK
jgi:hypothetical protein